MDANYWNSRYEKDNFPWDLKKASQPLIEICQELTDPETRILIPGAGSAYEAQWLYQQGFKQVTVVDWAEEAIERVRKRLPEFPEAQLVQGDFFAHRGEYDLILEQTFFCALPPGLRPDYMNHMHRLLAHGGSLRGVLFDFPFKEDLGPPWGGSETEYRERFSAHFNIEQLERCRNSEPERQGKELIFHVWKPLEPGFRD